MPTPDDKLILGTELLSQLLAGEVVDLKMLIAPRGAIILPRTSEHRSRQAEGIVYREDHSGTAMAAMLRRGEIEIRFHRAYPDAHATRIVGDVLAHESLAVMRTWKVTYQGRELTIE